MKNYLYTALALGLLGTLAADYPSGDQNATLQINSNDSFNTTGDRQIVLNIRKQLGSNQRYIHVALHVNSGVVTVSGYVQNQSDIAFLLDTVNKVNGVQVVINTLEVKEDENSYLNNPNANFYSEQNPDQYAANTANPYASGQLRSSDTYTSDSDRLIAMNIRSQLNSYLSNAYDKVSINVSGGAVTLSGTVSSQSALQNALQKVQAVPGVTSVKNQITVTNPGN